MTLETFFRIARWRSEGRDLSAKSLADRAVAWACWFNLGPSERHLYIKPFANKNAPGSFSGGADA